MTLRKKKGKKTSPKGENLSQALSHQKKGGEKGVHASKKCSAIRRKILPPKKCRKHYQVRNTRGILGITYVKKLLVVNHCKYAHTFAKAAILKGWL